MKNRFRELQRRVTEEGGSIGAATSLPHSSDSGRSIESLASPTASGRSRIVFAALDSDWILRLESTMPVANRVVLDDGPFIHPLLELLDEGRPAGVVLVSAEEARLLEWRVGAVKMVTGWSSNMFRRPRACRANRGRPEGQFHTPMREQRQARERDRMQRFLDQVTAVAAELADERGWERILVSGGERWTEPTIARFPQALRDKVFADPRVLSGLDDARWRRPSPKGSRQHNDREKQLLGRRCATPPGRESRRWGCPRWPQR